MLLLCIQLIFKFQGSKIESINKKISELKPLVLNLNFFKNVLISCEKIQKKDHKGNFYKTIKLVSEELINVNEDEIPWSVQFLENFFEIEPEMFTDYLDKFGSIIKKSNKKISEIIITFLAEIIISTGSKDKKKCSQILGKILKILSQISHHKIENFVELNIFLNLLFEKLNDDNFFYLLMIIETFSENTHLKTQIYKVVQSLNYFLQFENSFTFLRRLIYKYKTGNLCENEKEIYEKVFVFWAHYDMSMMVFSIISGNYQLFYELIIKISSRELDEIDLLALTKFVTFLELPQFAYIRLGIFIR